MDWVTEFIGCSAQHAWVRLRSRVKADFEQWSQLTENKSLSVTQDDEDLVIFGSRTGRKCWCALELTNGQIQWRHNLDPTQSPQATFTLTPAFNAQGECRLLLGGKELDFWQASRTILTPLLKQAG